MLNPKKIEIPSAKTYKLEAIAKVAESLRFPQLGRRTVLVAGTNGKGSTCAYLTALFAAAGMKVGTYTSPHVVHRTERIRINAKPVSEAMLKRYEKRYEKEIKALTYFEKMTILAFLIFRDLKVDVQILEVGMGGRLDATNISDPDISAITRIDYDHQEVLGKTLTLIASEKSGIMRSQRPCFTAFQLAEARKQIQKEAKQRKTRLKIVRPSDFSVAEQKLLRKLQDSWGDHQFQNAMIALKVFQRAQADWKGLQKLSSQKLKACLSADVLWPARLQIVRKKPLILVDGSHNMNSIDAFVSYWKEHHRDLKNVRCVFGVMEDKDVKEMLEKILPWVDHFHLPLFYPERQLKPQKLAQEIWKIRPTAKIQNHSDTGSCVGSLLKLANSQKFPIVCLGSLYLAGSFLVQLKGRRL